MFIFKFKPSIVRISINTLFFLLMALTITFGCVKRSKFNFHKPKVVNIILSLDEVSKLHPDSRGLFLDYTKKDFLHNLIKKSGLDRKGHGYFVLIDKPSPVFNDGKIVFEGELNEGPVVYSYPGVYHSLVWEP